MSIRIRQLIKTTLALWVGVGVLSAGFLVFLPELHAELHHHHGHGQHHDHDHRHPADDTPDHQCLIQFFSDGGVEQVSPGPELVLGAVGHLDYRLIELRATPGSDDFLLPPGRAPPAV